MKYVFSSGAWRHSSNQYAFVSGAWRNVLVSYVYSGGAWRVADRYRWVVGGWGGCSVGCGSGWQYRSVTCQNSANKVVSDTRCERLVGAKPATAQQCNTHGCTTCRYEAGATFPTSGSFVNICQTANQWLWDGSAISLSSGTEVISGGYRYTRGAKVLDVTCSRSTGGMDGTTIKYNGVRYEICRTPI